MFVVFRLKKKEEKHGEEVKRKNRAWILENDTE